MYVFSHARPRCVLAFEDGSVFAGNSVGADGECAGEVVFNTGMTGYQEILTDPSYKGQIVTMTYPHIGNYGSNEEEAESARPMAEGFVMREASRIASNWSSSLDLFTLLKQRGVVAADNVNTRAVTLHTRRCGAMRAVLSTSSESTDDLVDKARSSPSMVGLDLASAVTCERPYEWPGEPKLEPGRKALRVVVYDFGVKRSIMRCLAGAGIASTVVPATTSADEVLAMRPDGVFLSNGPGDPEPVTYAADAVRAIVGKLPLLGICLGHQILGLALGGRTYKLKFGHHGSNHPVKNLATGRIEITAQNHGFCVDAESLKRHEVRITHVNLNDQTVEGLELPKLMAFSAQFHPEAGPGPHDARGVFERFARLMRGEPH